MIIVRLGTVNGGVNVHAAIQHTKRSSNSEYSSDRDDRVLMRVFSFSLVSWLGPRSPFLFVWAFNTTDAVLLSWCAMIKKDMAYTVLNVFWVGVGIVGMLRAVRFVHP